MSYAKNGDATAKVEHSPRLLGNYLVCANCTDGVVEDEGKTYGCPVCDGDPNITYETVAEYSRQIDALLAERDALREALQELSEMYVHAWDLVDGGLFMSPNSVKKFEAAHAKAAAALKGKE